MSAPGKIEPTPKKYYLSLGSNINPTINIPKAIELLKKHGQLKAVSSAWKSPSMGSTGPDFINVAILFLSPIETDQIKPEIFRKIETELGRKRSSDKNAPREIDIDILIYEDIEMDPTLWSTPHTTVPLAEIYPEYRSKETNKMIKKVANGFLQKGVIRSVPELL